MSAWVCWPRFTYHRLTLFHEHYTHAYTHMHTHTHARTRTHAYTRTHTHTHIHTHTRTHTHTLTRTCTRTHTRTHTHIHTHTHSHTHTHAHTHTYAHTHTHTHTYTRTHTHTHTQGSVYHHTRHGRRPIPRLYQPTLQPSPEAQTGGVHVCDVTSLSFSLWQTDHFLAGYSDGSLRLFHTRRGGLGIV